MQTVSSEFAAAAASNTQQPISYLEISWNEDGDVTDARAAADWTDETAYMISHNGEISIEPPGENLVAAGDVGKLTIRLNNTTQRYSWQNEASPLNFYIDTATGLTGKPIRLWQGFRLATDEYVCIFTGIINQWTEDTRAGEVEISCRDWGFRFLQDKRSTALATDKLPNEWTAEMCALAGITSVTSDVGIFRIPYCWMDDESVVEEIWQVWEADGGLAYFDQCGKLHGESALHWFTSANDVIRWNFNEGTYVNSDPEFNADAIATKVIVEWSGRRPGPATMVYQLERAREIMPGETISWTARYQNAVYRLFTPTPGDPYNDYWAEGYGGRNLTDQISVTLSDEYAQQCKITIKNNSTSAMVVVTFLQIRGFPLLGGPTEQEIALPPAKPFSFERTRSFRGNPYLQTENQGAALASLKAIQCARIHPTWRINDVLGIPHLELGDKVRFIDMRAQGTGNTIDAIVISISWECSTERGFVQRLKVFDITSMMAYDYADYFIIGEDILGEYKRAYY